MQTTIEPAPSTSAVKRKPKTERPLKVYLAGKINKHDWRQEIFAIGDDDSWVEKKLIRPLESSVSTVAGKQFEFGGPWFIGCDHGCSHGNSTHGLMTSCSGNKFTARETVERCQKWIADSDVVFVWLDDPTAFGTLVEIGLAVGMGKPVFLYEPMTLTDTQAIDQWFARTVATFRRGHHGNALDAFQDFAGILDITELNSAVAAQDIVPTENIYLIRSGKIAGRHLYAFELYGSYHLATGANEVVKVIAAIDPLECTKWLEAYFGTKLVVGGWFALTTADLDLLDHIELMTPGQTGGGA